MKPLDKLAMKQVKRRLDLLQKAASEAQIRSGWIAYMRQAMTMTLTNLAKATGLSFANIQQIEKREPNGKVTIQTMRKIAHAMNCEFFYAFVPKQDLESYLKEKALEKAKRLVQETDVHMTLEDQKVKQDINERIERIAEDLLIKGDIW